MPHPKSISTIVEANDYLYIDEKGRNFIDLEAGIWCASLGHSHPAIVKIIKKQSEKLMHTSFKLKPVFINRAAKKLLSKADMNGKVFFMNTGSEAIDFAITLARLKNKHAEIVGFTDNYLGAYGQVSSIKQRININKCLKCKLERCSEECEQLNTKIAKDGIFIFDPFCFARKVLELPTKLVEFLKLELKKKNALLIMDEITAGLGRTGKWFGYQHYGLKPDLVVVGKTLGNGYPVSAVIIEENLVELIENSDFIYAQSHQNDPFGCAIAETVIDTLEKEKLIEASDTKGTLLLNILKKELSELNEVIEIRGKGLMIAIELSKSVSVESIYNRLMGKGIIIGISVSHNLLNIFPAYTIPENAFEFIANGIKTSIEEINV